MAVRRAVALCVLAWAWPSPLTARAQETGAQETEQAPAGGNGANAEREEAAALFAEGIAALDALDFPRARDLFERSLTTYGDAGTAFNLGLAYKGTGQLRRAVDVWRRILTAEYGDVTTEQRTELNALIDAARAQLAVLTLRAERPSSIEVSIDGEGQGTLRDTLPRTFELDPGRSVITADADGYQALVETVALESGERRSLTLALEPNEVEESRGVLSHPAFWVTVGIVVLAGIGTAVYFATAPHFADPVSEGPFGVVSALRAGP